MTNETPDRLTRIEDLAEANTRGIAELRESIRETKELADSNTRNIDILVGVVTAHQGRFDIILGEIRDMKAEIRDMQAEVRDMQAEIRGLQAESRHILEILLRRDTDNE